MFNDWNLVLIYLFIGVASTFTYGINYNLKDRTRQQDDMSNFKNFSKAIYVISATVMALLPIVPPQALLRVFYHSSFNLLGICISLVGLYIFRKGRIKLDSDFSPCSEIYLPKELKVDGMYKYMRHPIYTGNMLITFGSFVATGSLILLMLTLLMFFLYRRSTKLEERGLENQFPDYSDYKIKTPRFFPTPFRFHIATLKTESQREQFKKNFSESGGVKIDSTYLNNTQVKAFTDKTSGELLGGFIINSEAPYRYLALIPAAERNQLPFLKKHSHDLVEITCIWMKKSAELGYLEKIIFYLSSVYYACLTGKKKILGGTNNEKIKRIQMLALPTLVWTGIKDKADYPVWIYSGSSVIAFLFTMFIGVPIELVRRIAFR